MMAILMCFIFHLHFVIMCYIMLRVCTNYPPLSFVHAQTLGTTYKKMIYSSKKQYSTSSAFSLSNNHLQKHLPSPNASIDIRHSRHFQTPSSASNHNAMATTNIDVASSITCQDTTIGHCELGDCVINRNPKLQNQRCREHADTSSARSFHHEYSLPRNHSDGADNTACGHNGIRYECMIHLYLCKLYMIVVRSLFHVVLSISCGYERTYYYTVYI